MTDPPRPMPSGQPEPRPEPPIDDAAHVPAGRPSETPPPEPPVPARPPSSPILARAAAKVRDIVGPELFVTLYYNKRFLRYPGKDPQLVASRARERGTLLDHIDSDHREFVLLSIQQDRDRIAGLEGKGFAAAAVPSAIAAVSALLIGHGTAVTVFAIIALAYAGCAVAAAALIVLPKARENFSVNDAVGEDPLKKLVAANDANRDLGIRVNNLVNAALHDSLCATGALVVGALILLADRLGGDDDPNQPRVCAQTVATCTSPSPSTTPLRPPTRSATTLPARISSGTTT
jgi:hypothetical protein